MFLRRTSPLTLITLSYCGEEPASHGHERTIGPLRGPVYGPPWQGGVQVREDQSEKE